MLSSSRLVSSLSLSCSSSSCSSWLVLRLTRRHRRHRRERHRKVLQFRDRNHLRRRCLPLSWQHFQPIDLQECRLRLRKKCFLLMKSTSIAHEGEQPGNESGRPVFRTQLGSYHRRCHHPHHHLNHLRVRRNHRHHLPKGITEKRFRFHDHLWLIFWHFSPSSSFSGAATGMGSASMTFKPLGPNEKQETLSAASTSSSARSSKPRQALKSSFFFEIP